MDSYTVIVLIFGVVILISLILLYFINSLINYKRRVENPLLTVRELLEKRIELIKRMKEFIQKELENEESYLMKLKNIENDIQEFLKQSKTFKKFPKNKKDFLHFTTLDKTYSFLNKNQEYINIKNEVLTNQDKLIYALDEFDRGVNEYNNYRSKKIILFISKIFRFPEYDCYNKKI